MTNFWKKSILIILLHVAMHGLKQGLARLLTYKLRTKQSVQTKLIWYKCVDKGWQKWKIWDVLSKIDQLFLSTKNDKVYFIIKAICHFRHHFWQLFDR